ncbi:MAG: hypothetical protein ACK4N4_10500 [Burkholderiales bacterium]
MRQHWLIRPDTIRKLWRVFIVVLAGTVMAEFFIEHDAYFGIDGTFGFHAWYGFATCAAMIVFAKLLGVVLKRPDTYYGERDD